MPWWRRRPQVSFFYHVYADGRWQVPVAECRTVLRNSRFPGRTYVGLVGTPANRLQARHALGRALVVAEADAGYEQVTLAPLHGYAQQHDGVLVYAHTKGSHNSDPNRALWRRAMMLRVLDNWRANLRAMDAYDALGCFWLSQPLFPSVRVPFFAGNIWMARCDYLRRLPPCATQSRMDAEAWLGLGNPRVLDVLPGYPSHARYLRGIHG